MNKNRKKFNIGDAVVFNYCEQIIHTHIKDIQWCSAYETWTYTLKLTWAELETDNKFNYTEHLELTYVHGYHSMVYSWSLEHAHIIKKTPLPKALTT